jgi:hypothetical protein
VPRRGHITKVEQEKNRIRLTGDIETVVKFARSHRIEREPIRSVSRDALTRAAPQCRYVVLDDAGRVVLAGAVAPGDDFTFVIDVGGKLAPGNYTMNAFIAVNDNAMNAEIRSIPVRVATGE